MQIQSKLYQRSGKTINNFDMTLAGPQADLAKETLKNPYNFDFLMLGKDAHERDLEQALINHIQNFILVRGLPLWVSSSHCVWAGMIFILTCFFIIHDYVVMLSWS